MYHCFNNQRFICFFPVILIFSRFMCDLTVLPESIVIAVTIEISFYNLFQVKILTTY